MYQGGWVVAGVTSLYLKGEESSLVPGWLEWRHYTWQVKSPSSYQGGWVVAGVTLLYLAGEESSLVPGWLGGGWSDVTIPGR